MRSDQIQSMRQTHRSVSMVMPLVTAALTVTGVVLANMQRQAERQTREQGWQDGQAAQPPQSGQPQFGAPQSTQPFAYPYAIAPRVTRVVPVVSPLAAQRVVYRSRRLTLFGYLGTLLSRVLLVLIGMVAVATIVGVYFASDLTWRAIELTALILLILYLAERVARARRA